MPEGSGCLENAHGGGTVCLSLYGCMKYIKLKINWCVFSLCFYQIKLFYSIIIQRQRKENLLLKENIVKCKLMLNVCNALLPLYHTEKSGTLNHAAICN